MTRCQDYVTFMCNLPTDAMMIREPTKLPSICSGLLCFMMGGHKQGLRSFQGKACKERNNFSEVKMQWANKDYSEVTGTLRKYLIYTNSCYFAYFFSENFLTGLEIMSAAADLVRVSVCLLCSPLGRVSDKPALLGRCTAFRADFLSHSPARLKVFSQPYHHTETEAQSAALVLRKYRALKYVTRR